MKTMRILALMMLMLVLSGGAWAEDSNEKDDEWADFRMMMTERHQMVRNMMAMNREMMVILKNLDHRPSAADKEKLDNMIKDMDDMIAHDVEIGKRMMKKWKKEDWGEPGRGMNR